MELWSYDKGATKRRVPVPTRVTVMDTAETPGDRTYTRTLLQLDRLAILATQRTRFRRNAVLPARLTHT